MPLGPAAYRLFIRSRGGGRTFAELTLWSGIRWGRVLDEMSSAEVHCPVTHAGQSGARVLARANAFEHEVAIVRNDEEVWTGPLVEPTWEATGVTLGARDVFQWMERRGLPNDRDFFDEDLASIFSVLVADALSGDTSPNVNIEPHATGVPGTRTILADAGTRAADPLRELARSGLDFTVIGRNVRCGGSEIPTSLLPPFTNDIFASPPQIRGAGLLTASQVTVLGAHTGDFPVVGRAGGVGFETGLVERIFNESSIEDESSAMAAAATRLDMLSTMPVFVTGELDPRRAPALSHLIPGAVAPVILQVGVREVNAHLRLASLDVDVSSGDQGVSEKVSVSFIPLGSVEGG